MHDHSSPNEEIVSNRYLAALLIAVIIVLISSSLLPLFTQQDRVGSEGQTPPAMNSSLSQLSGAQEIATDTLDQSNTAIRDRTRGPEVAIATIPRGDIEERSAASPSGTEQDAEAGGPLSGVDFDLASLGATDPDVRATGNGQIAVQKPVFAGNVSLGSMTVIIDRNARLYFDKSELADLLSESGRPVAAIERAGRGPSASFQELRAAGLDLRYDPVRDRIILSQ